MMPDRLPPSAQQNAGEVFDSRRMKASTRLFFLLEVECSEPWTGIEGLGTLSKFMKLNRAYNDQNTHVAYSPDRGSGS